MLLVLVLLLILRQTCSGIVHLDIEPHSLSEWTSDRNGIATQWLNLLTQINTKITAHAGQTLTIDVAMSYSIASAGMVTYSGVEKLLIEHVFNIVDTVVVMTYRNHAKTCAYDGFCPLDDSIISHAKLAMSAAKVAEGGDKNVYLGVETNPTLTPTKLTFGVIPALKGEEAMEKALTEAMEELQACPDMCRSDGKTPILSGFAVHDFTYYSAEAFGSQTDASWARKAASRTCRSLWVWDTDYVLSLKGKTPERLIEFAVAHGVNSLILEASGLVEDDLSPQLVSFMKKARLEGVAVEILLGTHEGARTSLTGFTV